MTINLLKKLEEKEFVWLGAQELKGISQKTNQPYEMYIASFADPDTFENHQLNYRKGTNLTFITKGERFKLVLDLVKGYGNKNSAVEIIDVHPVK